METTTEPLKVVGLFPWWRFWSMGEGRGAPSFYLSVKAFVDRGHELTLLQLRRDEPPGIVTEEGIELVRFRGGPRTILEDPEKGRFVRFFIRNFVFLRYTVSAYIAGVRTIRRVRPDVLVGYGDHSALVTYLLAKTFRLPHVTRLFGTFLSRYLDRPLSKVLLHYHYIQVWPLILPASAVVLCDDGSEGDRVAAALGVPEARFRFWRNGTNHDLHDPAADPASLRRRLGLPADGALLFTVCRLHPEKHVERILRALPAVHAEHPRVRFVLVGSGEEEAALREEAQRLGVSDLVIWAGPVERDQLGDWINACDLFVAMSDRTNVANPFFEASICGKPSVLLATGGTPRVIDHGTNGWLVPEDRPEALGPLLVDILRDLPGVRRAGAQARAWAVEHVPTYERRQEMEVELVEEAVRSWRAGRSRRRGGPATPAGEAEDRRVCPPGIGAPNRR